MSNEVRACGSSGIGFNQTDYITIADSTVYDSWYSIYGAISINSSWNSDGFIGYKFFFILRNRVFGNCELVPWKAACYISDGEGIIIDTNCDKSLVQVSWGGSHDHTTGWVHRRNGQHVSGNTVFNCSWYAAYGTSAISILGSYNSDASTATKNFVTGNRIYNNYELVPYHVMSPLTISDG